MMSKSFLAEVQPDCKVLVLGSMPGIVSLDAVEYYANSRNAFWPIMQVLLQLENDLPYQQRLAALKNKGVGLWDVYKTCYREGSLDSAIQTRGAEFNDISNLVEGLPQLSCIACNGLAAAKAFKRLSKEQGGILEARGIHTITLPSTSPAYAAMKLDKKLEQWQVLASFLNKRPVM